MKGAGELEFFKLNEPFCPTSKPVTHAEGKNNICCTEVPQYSKPKLCEGAGAISHPPPTKQCLYKTRTISRPTPRHPRTYERDILFRPIRWRCKQPAKVNEKKYEPSLGAPIGISKSSFSMTFLEAKKSELPLQGFATLLVAFAEYFLTPEIEWDEKVLNRILLEGQRLYTESKFKLSQGDKIKEDRIRKTFKLCENTFDVAVTEPFLIGRVVGNEMPVPNLHCGLLKFFKNFQFCLLQIGSWYVLLWKNADVYFVFDCYGRRLQDFRSDRKAGIAVLFCLRNLDNVSHLILNLSGIEPDQLFTIRQMQIKSLIPCGGEPIPEIVDRSIQFEIVSPDYALLRASMQLGSNCFKEIKHRHSLPVAVVALVNAKIDATPTWDRGVLDKIIKMGAQFYKQWTQCDISLDLGIQDIPSKFVMGQFMVQIAVNPIAECGLWKCTPNYRNSDLTIAIRKAFEQCPNLLLQIQGRSYAMWKKGLYYYVLDPYSHQCSVGKKKMPTASLRMCGSVDRMCCILTQALLELFEESKFLIHLVKIVHLELLENVEETRRQMQTPCMCLATPITDIAHEVCSLNDSVLGVDGYECAEEVQPAESDGADLDSPGLSQMRMDDYTDLRRDFIDESDEEEDEEDENLPEVLSADILDEKRNGDSDDDAEGATKGNKGKKDKKGKDSKKSAGGDDENRGQKRGHDDKKSQQKDDEGGEKKRRVTDQEEKDKENTPRLDIEKVKHDIPPIAFFSVKIPGDDESDAPEDSKKSGPSDQDGASGDSKKSRPTDQDGPSEDNKKSRPSDQDGASEGSKTDVKSTKTPSRRQRRQRRKEQDGDDTSADEIPRAGLPGDCKPNAYPGFTEDPQDLAVVGSENGNYESLCSLLKSAFRCADRVLTMTPWGNYVAFHCNRTYFIFDGCTCNLRSIRHMDLTVGTAGLLCFSDMHSLIKYIESGKESPRPTTSTKKNIVDQICNQYCGRK